MKNTDLSGVEELIEKHGCTDHRWVSPADIVVAHWVRMKCRYGCPHFGKVAVCPPNTPTVQECRELFAEYGKVALLRFHHAVAKPEDRHAWTRSVNRRLLALERDVFLAGHHKALVLFIDPCNMCKECVPDARDCLLPAQARPSPEGLAVDVFGTARAAGLEIEVLSSYDQPMNRYGLLLLR